MNVSKDFLSPLKVTTTELILGVSLGLDKKSFETFMESLILDYLNSCSIAKSESQNFIGKVENNMKSA